MKILTKRAIYGSLRSKGLILKLELWLLLAYLNLSKLELQDLSRKMCDSF